MQSPPQPAMVGLEARMTGRPRPFAPYCPRYKIEALPTATLQHIKESQRRTSPALSDFLFKKFNPAIALTLGPELSPSKGLGYARTFSCSVKDTDSIPHEVPVPDRLIVKLFDDRTGKLADLELAGNYPLWWSQNFITAHEMVANEICTYLRLRDFWGSIVPWFYGAFMVCTNSVQSDTHHEYY